MADSKITNLTAGDPAVATDELPINRSGGLDRKVTVGSVRNPARASTLTIASGAITVTNSFHYVDTEAAAAFDILDTINGGVDGMRVILMPADGARTVFVTNGTGSTQGNIRIGPGIGTDGATNEMETGFQLDDDTDLIELIFDATQSKWIQVSYYSIDTQTSWHNVKDFGAVGDGVTDDFRAIIKAMVHAAGSDNGGTVYFPIGLYSVSAALNFLFSWEINFIGAPGAEIVGTHAGFVFDRSTTGGAGPNGVCSFQNLIIRTTNTAGGCIKIEDTLSAKITSCRFGLPAASTGIAVFMGTASSAVTIDSCCFTGSGKTGIAICGSNGIAIINCDVVGFAEGFRHFNIGFAVISGRWEVNGVGMMLGKDNTGASNPSQNGYISGVSMESNDIHIFIFNGGNLTIDCMEMHSFTGTETHGIFVVDTNNLRISNCRINGGYISSVIQFTNNPTFTILENLELINATAPNTLMTTASGQDTSGWRNISSWGPMAQDFSNSTITGVTSQVVGTTIGHASLARQVFANNNTAFPHLFLSKGRTADITISTAPHTIVQSGDILGKISWQGDDSVDFCPAAEMRVEVDGTPGSNDMPGRLIIATTADGASTATDRWTVDASGNFKRAGAGAGLMATAATSATIASGAITATSNYMIVDTEGAAATDDLDTINGGLDGAVLTIRAANGARDVVVKDGTQLKLAGDHTLDNVEDTITLRFDSTLSQWLEQARSNNGA